MNPPGDADTDGSPSNCTAFFISTVHDLSLYETHAPRSPPPHTRDFPISLCFLHRFHLSLSFSFHFSTHLLSYSVQLSTPLYSSISLFLSSSLCLSVSLCCGSEPPPPSSSPFCWFSLQCRCAPGQQWPGWETTEVTLRLGDGSLVVTDTQSYYDETSTAYLQGRQRGERGKK